MLALDYFLVSKHIIEPIYVVLEVLFTISLTIFQACFATRTRPDPSSESPLLCEKIKCPQKNIRTV